MLMELKKNIVGRYRFQYEFAQKTRIPENRLSAIVHERVRPTDGERTAIAEALGVPEADIFPQSEEVRAG